MISYLLDSDFLVALFKKDDHNHTRAVRLKNQISHHHQIFISQQVISESVTVLSQKINHKTAVKFLIFLNKHPEITIIYTNHHIQNLANKIFLIQTSKNVSFVDCVNMAIFKETEATAIISFDLHYPKNNIPLLTQP